MQLFRWTGGGEGDEGNFKKIILKRVGDYATF